MNLFKTSASLSLILFSISLLTSCAAGSATAGYALKANTSDNLSADAEQRIVDRAKREMKAEMSTCPSGQR